jgi:hypothetical protein
MTETAKRILIIGLVLVAAAAGGYFYVSASGSGRHQVQDF